MNAMRRMAPQYEEGIGTPPRGRSGALFVSFICASGRVLDIFRHSVIIKLEVELMGMTDKQFNGYLRLVLDVLEEVQKEVGDNEKLQRLIEHIRDTIED